HRASGDAHRHHAVVAVGHTDALYGLGLLAGRGAPPHPGGCVKLLYFAWVSERVGKAEEEIDPPAGVASVGAPVRWLTQRGARCGYAFENPKVIRPDRDRSHVRADTRIDGPHEIAFFPPMTAG